MSWTALRKCRQHATRAREKSILFVFGMENPKFVQKFVFFGHFGRVIGKYRPFDTHGIPVKFLNYNVTQSTNVIPLCIHFLHVWICIKKRLYSNFVEEPRFVQINVCQEFRASLIRMNIFFYCYVI